MFIQWNADPEEVRFEAMKDQTRQMPKKNIKKHLQKRGLSTKGSHDVLMTRLLTAIEEDHDAHREQTEAERIAWEAEQEQLAEEQAERDTALAHLGKLNDKYAKLKSPALRKQLAKRGLSTKGKKTVLLERLAEALETEYAAKREQEKRIKAEEARIAEIAEEQEAADVEHKQLVRDIKAMKKKALVTELKEQGLETKGKLKDLIARLLEAVNAEKEAADEERREASLTESDRLAREIAEQEAEEERLRIEAEEALAEQEAEEERIAAEEAAIGASPVHPCFTVHPWWRICFRYLGLIYANACLYEDPEEVRFQKMKDDVQRMPKKNIKKHLERRGLSSKGSHDVLMTRLLAAIEEDHDAHREQTEAERIAWEAEQERLADENNEREAALAHLGKLNSKFAKLKAPGLRKQLEKRGLSTKGKKTVLLERLADALEKEMEGTLEQKKRIKAEEARIAEIAEEQEAADAEFTAFKKAVKKMKKKELVAQLEDRELETKGKQDELSARLLEAATAEKEAADADRREESMTESERLAREIAEQEAEEERLRIEAEEALAEQIAEEEEAARLADEEEYNDPGKTRFEKLKAEVRDMPKKNIKKHLEKRGLSAKGNHDVLTKRLLAAFDEDHDAHREQTFAERAAWEAEQERLAEEQAERESALAHLGKLNDKYAKLKSPALRKQLAKRGLSTKGKKTALLERLADALETEYAAKREQQKLIKAEEARIAEIAEEQEAADAEHSTFLRQLKAMKKKELIAQLEDRDLNTKGKLKELSARLLEAVNADKEAADADRREESMTESERLAREIAEQEAEEERLRIEAEEALAEQIAEEEEAARLADEEEYNDPGKTRFEKLKAEVRDMPKKNIKKHLEKRGLSAKGNHDVLMKRLLAAFDEDHDAHREQTFAERAAWEAEQEQLAEEQAERDTALAHLGKLNDKYAKLKSPALRKQLAKRGLSTKGKKTALLERLADALEAEYAAKLEQQKRIKAEEARIAEIAEEQEAADERHTHFTRQVKRMKKKEMTPHLLERSLPTKGKMDILTARLLEAVNAEKEAADEERREASLTESDRLAREIAEQKAEEERLRIEAEEALAEQEAEEERIAAEEAAIGASPVHPCFTVHPWWRICFRYLELIYANACLYEDPEEVRFQKMKDDVQHMPKKNIKEKLETRGLSTKGSHDVLMTRLLAAIEEDHDAHREQTEAERIAWETEQEQLAEEQAERDTALAHLGKLNAKFVKLKAPGLRKQLEKRGLSTKGKKTVLLERLADALEKEMEGKLEQQKRIKAEEARIAEIAEEQEAADAEFKAFKREVRKMKKPALMKELKARELEIKGKQEELSARLVDAVTAEKEAADELRREESMTEEEKLAREVAEQEAEEERERIEAEEALAEQLAEEEEAARLAEEDERQDPGKARFEKLKDDVQHMPKKNIKKKLEKRGLSTKGSHDMLMKRLLSAIDEDQTSHREQTLAERAAWEAEQEQLAEEQAERDTALAHLGKLNAKFVKLKAPGLRKQLEKRGLSTKGKKTVLLERLADALEKEMEGKLEQQKRIKAEEARIAEIAEEQEAADAEFKAFKKEIKAMKKPALMKELKARELEIKGKQDELSARLLDAVTAEKEAADELRREESMTEEEKLAREVAEQEAEEERERIEAEEALAEQEAEEMSEFDHALAVEAVRFDRIRAETEALPKKNVKKHLEKRGLSTKGSHDVLVKRLLTAIDDEQTNHREQTEAERIAWEAEQEQLAEEQAERDTALVHLGKLNDKYVKLKAPGLRKQLEKRGLSTKGKKTVLLERLADALEKEMEGKLEQQKRIKAEEAKIAEIAEKQEAADAEFKAFKKEIKAMKKKDLVTRLEERKLDSKGKDGELSTRLLDAVTAEKEAADELRREESMTEEEKLAREVAEQEAEEERERIEAEEALEQQRLAEMTEFDKVAMEEDSAFEVMKDQVEHMPKKNIKSNLDKRGLSTKGTHDVLMKRLIKAIESDHDAHREQSDVDRAAWEAEQEQLAEEQAEREAALAHLGKLNAKFVKLKAPGLRKQLEKRGLSTKGKKTVLLERLADALEKEMEGKLEQQKRIKAEEARIAEIAEEQEAADAEFMAFKKAVKKMKKPALMKELKARELEIKGKQEELSARLLDAVTAEKEAADELRREESMTEEEKLAREVAEQEAEEERERIEAEEALAEQLAEE
eukprot:SAG22_NODE_624_length_8453_cov_1742.782499_1_plen_2188_part_10